MKSFTRTFDILPMLKYFRDKPLHDNYRHTFDSAGLQLADTHKGAFKGVLLSELFVEIGDV